MKKCCYNCSHLNDEVECRCPNSEHYEEYIPCLFNVSCPEHEYDESKED